MATKTKTTVTDPFAAVRETILDAVKAAQAEQEKLMGAAQAEADKARVAAVEGFDKAVVAYQENFDAAVAATKAAAENLSKIEGMTRAQLTEIAEDRVAAATKALSVTDPAELFKLQAELVKAEHKKAQAIAKETVAVYQGIANDMVAPIQAQMTKAFEQAAKFKAA
ncbi:MAG: phasin family protein [Rhodospirillaceae bacterium]